MDFEASQCCHAPLLGKEIITKKHANKHTHTHSLTRKHAVKLERAGFYMGAGFTLQSCCPLSADHSRQKWKMDEDRSPLRDATFRGVPPCSRGMQKLNCGAIAGVFYRQGIVEVRCQKIGTTYHTRLQCESPQHRPKHNVRPRAHTEAHAL